MAFIVFRKRTYYIPGASMTPIFPCVVDPDCCAAIIDLADCFGTVFQLPDHMHLTITGLESPCDYDSVDTQLLQDVIDVTAFASTAQNRSYYLKFVPPVAGFPVIAQYQIANGAIIGSTDYGVYVGSQPLRVNDGGAVNFLTFGEGSLGGTAWNLIGPDYDEFLTADFYCQILVTIICNEPDSDHPDPFLTWDVSTLGTAIIQPQNVTGPSAGTPTFPLYGGAGSTYPSTCSANVIDRELQTTSPYGRIEFTTCDCGDDLRFDLTD